MREQPHKTLSFRSGFLKNLGGNRNSSALNQLQASLDWADLPWILLLQFPFRLSAVSLEISRLVLESLKAPAPSQRSVAASSPVNDLASSADQTTPISEGQPLSSLQCHLCAA